MLLITVLLVVFALATSPADCGELQKEYFQATQPGAWVKVEVSYNNGGRSVYTYSRLDDNRGRGVVEFEMDVLEGPGEGTSNRQLYVIERGAELSKNALGYMKKLQALITEVGGQVSVTPANVVEVIREGSADYSNSFSFEKTENVAGIECDRYAYRVTTGGPHPTTTEGTLWFNDRIPFGVVKQTGTVTGADGNPLSSYEQTYLDSGAGAVGSQQLVAYIGESSPPIGFTPHLESESPAARAAYSFSEAYDSGVIRLLVTVDAATNGERLLVSMVNSTSESIRVSIPTNDVRLAADSPINTLAIAAVDEQGLDLAPGASSPAITFRQLGDRGVVEGDFSLIVYEGTPLYTGSVTIGAL